MKEFQGKTLLLHQGVPLFPMGNPLLYLLTACLLLPPVVCALIMNAVPYGAAWWAGMTLPDGRNVISLWKILVGIPVFIIWGALVLLGDWPSITRTGS